MRHALLFVSLTGCTAFYSSDLNKKQCEVDADCASDGGAAYMCLDNVCQTAAGCQPACAPGFTCVGAMCMGTGPRSCATESDCGSGERCGYDNLCYAPWGCLSTPDDFTPASAPYHVKTQLARLDFPGTADPGDIGEVDVKVCVSEDPACAGASLVPAEQISQSATRQLDITFPAKFNGLVKITPRTAAYLPSYLHVPAASPFVLDQTTQRATPLSNALVLQLLPRIVLIDADSTKALLGTFLYDCGGRPASGVSLRELNPNATSKFFAVGAGSVPVQNATATDDEGTGFLVDLTPNMLTSIQLVEQQNLRVLATFSLVPQANGFNVVNFYPRNSALKAWLAYNAKQPPK